MGVDLVGLSWLQMGVNLVGSMVANFSQSQWMPILVGLNLCKFQPVSVFANLGLSLVANFSQSQWVSILLVSMVINFSMS